MHRRHIAVAAGLILATGAVGITAWARVQDPTPKGSRTAFMRQKLEFTKDVLEGLTTENFAMIEKNGKLLKKLSTASEWEVPTIPNVEEYLPYTTEFQRLCDELTTAAKAKNIDGATLAYVRLATNCVNCHKYVRNVGK
jgi:cytochrome c556